MQDYKLVEGIKPAHEQLVAAIKTQDMICVTGPETVGKSTVTRLAFEQNKEILAAFVSCLVIASPVHLFTSICSQFQAEMDICKKDKAGKLLGSYRVGQLVYEPDFPRYCAEYCRYAKRKGIRRLFIVVDNFDLAIGTPLFDSIGMLMTLPSVGIIIVTEKSPTNICECLTQHFPRVGLIAQDRMLPIFIRNWSKQDLIDNILENQPTMEANLYKKFVQNVVNILYIDCSRNVREIKNYCQQNFPDFLKYYEKNLKERIDEIDSDYLDDCSLLNQRQVTNLTSTFLHTIKQLMKTKDVNSQRLGQLDTRLTYNAAFMVIAAYIAAHTNPSDDKNNFSIHSRNKTKRGGKHRGNTGLQTSTFTMERVLHIFKALVESDVGEKISYINNNDTILTDLERLEGVGLIQVAGGDGFSPDTRYKLSPSIKEKYVKMIAMKFEFTTQFNQIMG